jgi:hypothetical protein
MKVSAQLDAFIVSSPQNCVRYPLNKMLVSPNSVLGVAENRKILAWDQTQIIHTTLIYLGLTNSIKQSPS